MISGTSIGRRKNPVCGAQDDPLRVDMPGVWAAVCQPQRHDSPLPQSLSRLVVQARVCCVREAVPSH